MVRTITAVYEKGVLRPLIPLSLPEHTRVELQIIKPVSVAEDERHQVRQALMAAGVIRPQPLTEAAQSVPEADLAKAAQALGQAGPLSDFIIAERKGR